MRTRLIAALVLLLAGLAFAPGVDAMMCDVQEQVMDGAPHTAVGGEISSPHHHCAFSANPAGVESIALSAGPVMLTWTIADDVAIAAHHAPSAPSAPPRA